MGKTNGKILKYALLPGFIPRIMNLATSGFSTLAYYIAAVYNIVKLIPDDHPYLLSQNFGKYGIRHVIAEAANNLVFKKEHADQILVFFTILIGLITIVIQVILLIVALMTYQSAFAIDMGFPIVDLFRNDGSNPTTGSMGPTHDIAFIVLDRVFGLVGIFESCVSLQNVCEDHKGLPSPSQIQLYPHPFHEALHALLRFYSTGIVFVAAMLFIYFTTTIVGETAATGTPFGQRFNRAWAPVRFVLFFGLIIPLNIGGGTGAPNAGINGAQLITFYAAKHGSNFATNGWAYFNRRLVNETFLGPQERVIAVPSRPEMGSLNQFILTAKTCALAERRYVTSHRGREIEPFIVKNNEAPQNFIGTDYDAALAYSENGNITVRFGTQGEDRNGDGVVEEHQGWAGNIFPYCGEMVFRTTDVHEPGSTFIASQYYAFVQQLWQEPMIERIANCIVDRTVSGPDIRPLCPDMPDRAYVQNVTSQYNQYVDDTIRQGIEQQVNGGDFTVPNELISVGWAGAAIWFNRVAEMNGAVYEAAMNIPIVRTYPWSMEEVSRLRAAQNEDAGGNPYDPELSQGYSLDLRDNRQMIYPAIYTAYNFWIEDSAAASSTTGNHVIDIINLILGTGGIFDMRNNVDINPLAQLTAVGKGMIEATIRNTAIAGIATLGGGLWQIMSGTPQRESKIVAGFMVSMITVGIGIGIILFYVVPFLPFIYFLFAFSGWIKSIFEAIVAMPLWALAHIRIDGEGIPGQDASNGYFLILEIFLRPILIVIGLLASITIFSAIVSALNAIFPLLTRNVGGSATVSEAANPIPSLVEYVKGPLDEFFFTAMYAIICYLFATSCFKMVDMVPNNILRWIGANAATFQENAGDPAGTLTTQVYKGTLLASNQVKGATGTDLGVITAGG